MRSIGNGNIPLSYYLRFLSKVRILSKSQIINYTLEIYDTNIELAIDDFIISDYNYLNEFKINKMPTREDDKTRDYFDSYGRSYYYKFLEYLNKDIEMDCLSVWQFSSDVHHIHPLFYGGDSNLENLILLSKINHQILHKNILESERKFCFMSLDYLAYLYSDYKYYEIIKKYRINSNTKDDLFKNIYLLCIENEMDEFYDLISKG